MKPGSGMSGPGRLPADSDDAAARCCRLVRLPELTALQLPSPQLRRLGRRHCYRFTAAVAVTVAAAAVMARGRSCPSWPSCPYG